MVLKDLTVGLHHIQVRAVPVHGDPVTIGDIPVIVECPLVNRPSFGDLESPTVMEAMQGRRDDYFAKCSFEDWCHSKIAVNQQIEEGKQDLENN